MAVNAFDFLLNEKIGFLLNEKKIANMLLLKWRTYKTGEQTGFIIQVDASLRSLGFLLNHDTFFSLSLPCMCVCVLTMHSANYS